MKRICVFCGSSQGVDPVFAQAATTMGHALAERRLGLVYGGGNIGLMGILADAVLQRGGAVIGVIPESLREKELAHRSLTELHVVGSMHERKALMAELADAFIALPGGFGTLDEFCEILTWAQLGFHVKPCGLLNVSGFYDPFLSQIQHAVRTRFIRPEHADLIRVEADPPALLRRLEQAQPASQPKWLDRDSGATPAPGNLAALG